MIIYNGRYNWSGKKVNQLRPISWWPGSYNLKIIKIVKSRSNVYIIKPHVVIFSDTGEGFSARDHTQNLAKKVCRDFKLDINKVLWIEYYPKKPASMEVAMLKPATKIGSDTIYSVTWRPIRPNELELIMEYVPEAGQIAKNMFQASQ